MDPYHNWRIFSGTEPVYFPQSTVTGMTPFIRENDINFAVKNLKPDASANIFFDEIKVNNFSQRASIVNANSSVALSSLKINQGLYATTSKAYAEVLGTSVTGTQNLVYINDNFISVKINNAPALSVTSSDFAEGDFVYQTNDNVGFDYSVYNGLSVPPFTFLGRVKKWEYIDGSNGVLVVDPLSGRLNLTSTAASSDNIFNLTKFGVYQKANNVFANNRFQTGETVQFAKTSTLAFQVSTAASNSAYVALSSAVTAVNTANSPNRSIVLSTNDTSRDGLRSLIGNTIYIVSGTNMGFSASIVNVVANTITGWNEAILNKTLPETSTSNTIYSIGDHIVDDVGAMYGIFHIPSLDNLRWLTGERVLTVTDTATHNDNEYKMRAVAKYNALGKINSIENARNTVVTEFTPATQQAAPKVTADAPKINDRKNMAQTFFTPRANEIVNGQVKGSYGIYVTSVDLFFKSKPTDNEELLPFTVAITKVENGLPSNEQIASRTLEPAYIITSNTPNYTTNTSLNNIATKFTFADPVYLLPSTEYAIVLLTESPDYEVWTASVGEEYTDELGNVRKVSDQPYVGNFFKSQNASNWNPILNQDLMFRVNRASFESSNTVYFNLEPRAFLQQVGNFMTNTVFDMVKISSTDQIPSPTNISYDIRTKLTDGTEAAYLRINNNEIYNFGKDTNISSSFSKRRRLINYANVESVNVRVTMTTNDETTTPIINGERMSLYTFQNIINNAGIANNLITITNPGGAFVSHSTINVQFSDPDVGTNKATGNITPGLLSSGEILGINIINPGAGYLTTPTITITDNSSAATANAVINGETDASGGNILARYQTKIVELEDGFEAGDLVVRLNAIKPAGTDVHVYLKVLSELDAEPFTSKKWLKMTPIINNISPDQNTIVPVEYRYSLQTGEIKYFDGAREMPLGGKFKYFAVKIRLTAADPAVVPSVESLRVIAVPAG